MGVIATRTDRFITFAVISRCRHDVFDEFPIDLVRLLMDEEGEFPRSFAPEDKAASFRQGR